ncbi:hypothetical protein [Burkholderia sp. 22PA0106]|uniref:hypothetical protein n=1 Tax=Burkholderia sp. 22PA0106 TaxID=3237371 RepID=UPI0039C4C48F
MSLFDVNRFDIAWAALFNTSSHKNHANEAAAIGAVGDFRKEILTGRISIKSACIFAIPQFPVEGMAIGLSPVSQIAKAKH